MTIKEAMAAGAAVGAGVGAASAKPGEEMRGAAKGAVEGALVGLALGLAWKLRWFIVAAMIFAYFIYWLSGDKARDEALETFRGYFNAEPARATWVGTEADGYYRIYAIPITNTHASVPVTITALSCFAKLAKQNFQSESETDVKLSNVGTKVAPLVIGPGQTKTMTLLVSPDNVRFDFAHATCPMSFRVDEPAVYRAAGVHSVTSNSDYKVLAAKWGPVWDVDGGYVEIAVLVHNRDSRDINRIVFACSGEDHSRQFAERENLTSNVTIKSGETRLLHLRSPMWKRTGGGHVAPGTPVDCPVKSLETKSWYGFHE